MLHLEGFWKSKACGQTKLPDRSVLKKDKNCWKMPKFKNSNATFWVTFKQCVYVAFHDDYFKYLINVLHTVTIDPSVSWPTMYLLGKKVHWKDVICSKISVDAKKTAVGNCIIFSSLPFGQAKATLNFFRQKSFLICPGCCFCGLKSRPRLFLLSHTTISRP